MKPTPTFDGLSVYEHAERVAASVRAVNHLTFQPPSLPYPSDIYRVVIQIALATQRLAQTFRQLDERLGTLAIGGEVIGLDSSAGGTRPLTFHGALDHARALADAVQAAAEYLSRLGYDIDGEQDR